MNPLGLIQSLTVLFFVGGLSYVAIMLTKGIKNRQRKMHPPDVDGWAPGPIALEFIKEFYEDNYVNSDEPRRITVLSNLKALSDTQFAKFYNQANELLASDEENVTDLIKNSYFLWHPIGRTLREETLQRIIKILGRA